MTSERTKPTGRIKRRRHLLTGCLLWADPAGNVEGFGKSRELGEADTFMMHDVNDGEKHVIHLRNCIHRSNGELPQSSCNLSIMPAKTLPSSITISFRITPQGTLSPSSPTPIPHQNHPPLPSSKLLALAQPPCSRTKEKPQAVPSPAPNTPATSPPRPAYFSYGNNIRPNDHALFRIPIPAGCSGSLALASTAGNEPAVSGSSESSTETGASCWRVLA